MTMAQAPTTLRDPAMIDLTRHAVIEASAGTGKTYAIEGLVMRLLLEKRIPIDEILVLTFTEKATGELKKRIRDRIVKLIEKPAAPEGDLSFLKDALETFDTAPICTIHSFCHRVLQQYAFENGEPFAYNVQDDLPLYEKMLKEQMRKDWKIWFGPDLDVILRLSAFSGKEDAWMAATVRLARSFRPDALDRLIPEPQDDPAGTYASYVKVLAAGVERLAKVVGTIVPDALEQSDVAVRYSALVGRQDWVGPRMRTTIVPMLRILAEYAKSGKLPVPELQELMAAGTEKADKGGFAYLIDSTMKKKGYAAVMPELDGVVAALEDLRKLSAVTPHILRSCAIAKLKTDVERYKRERAILSYEDMVNLVDRALASSELLAEELRRRYRYALIDEFQDTDTVQWQIARRIFLEGGENRLLVIGDPKQAIYSFRGADVYAYIQAKECMVTEYGAAFYALETNWRSTPQLIGACNRLFKDGGWFAGIDIDYRDVDAPPAADRKTRLYADRTKRAAITAVDLRAARNGGDAHRMMCGFIADEIERLLDDKGASLLVGDRASCGPVSAGDICVLVKARGKARLLEAFLAEKKIPYSFYKKRGLYQSAEAAHVQYLLSAIVDPADEGALKKALLTPFFAIPPREIAAYADLPPSAPLKELFQEWFGYASARLWPQLFRSILEDTGVLFRELADERRIANYRQVIENLESEAVTGHLDAVDLAALLERYRKTEEFDDETFDMHRLETERPKVKIMTIHASKGLESPVIFMADGFTELAAASSTYWKYHDAERRIVYDLVRRSEDEHRFDAERMRENRQLYYVALTRAKYKLYIPYFGGTAKAKGPMASIIYPAITAAWPDTAQDASMLRFVDVAGDDLEAKPPLAVVCDADRPKPAGTEGARAVSVPAELFPDLPPSFAGRKLEITSYSGLKERLEAPTAGKGAIDRSWITSYDDPTSRIKEEDDDEPGDPVRRASEERIILPPSNTTGSMLHEIFEEIDFRTVGKAASSDKLLDDPVITALFERKLAYYGLVKKGASTDPAAVRACMFETARIVWQTLVTPLSPAGRRLADLGVADARSELEFYYPLPQPRQAPRVKEVRYRDGFLMGYIDLVFRFGERYYLLDWKSNYLENGYGSDAIAESMAESGYDLQYKVYSIAVVRWLKERIKDFEYDKHFGGVYYLYLRGMDTQKPAEGYFFTRPKDENELRSYEDEIAKLVNR